MFEGSSPPYDFRQFFDDSLAVPLEDLTQFINGIGDRLKVVDLRGCRRDFEHHDTSPPLAAGTTSIASVRIFFSRTWSISPRVR